VIEGRARGFDVDDYQCEFDAKLWVSESNAAWTFLSLPVDAADDIAAAHAGRARGFGSVRVEASIGASTWCTSIFPDSKLRTFVLPVKKAIRNAEGVEAGTTVRVALRTLPTE
jgi:hypothetical protein